MEKQSILCDLWNLVVNKNEIRGAFTTINKTVQGTFENCFDSCFSKEQNDLKQEIDSIIYYLHDELNTGHWSEIPLSVRRAFTSSTFIKFILLVKNAPNSLELSLLEECLKCIDMGLLLGAPLEENPDLLTQCATYLSQKTEKTQLNFNKKRKNHNADKFLEHFDNLKAVLVQTLVCPSLECFNKDFFVPQVPVKLQGCMSHWPAMSKWMDINYLLKVAGNRTVPVEIGSKYTDEDWAQKLMTIKDFIVKHFLGNSPEIGYLAQHNLFEQIPELKSDIHIPEYCCLGESDLDPEINAWFGPEGTVSPLHNDPKNNILAQIFGTKELILFHPNDTKFLYPHEDTLLSNTSQVNPIEPNLLLYPNFTNATMFKCLLEPGEMLYIPMKWWHQVSALEKSFSVSFWWE